MIIKPYIDKPRWGLNNRGWMEWANKRLFLGQIQEYDAYLYYICGGINKPAIILKWEKDGYGYKKLSEIPPINNYWAPIYLGAQRLAIIKGLL